MRIFANITPALKITRRISCNYNARQYTSLVQIVQCNRSYNNGNLWSTNCTLRRFYRENRTFKKTPVESDGIKDVPVDGNAGSIIPVALIDVNPLNSTSAKVLLIPLNWSNDNEAVIKNIISSILSQRRNIRQIEAFSNALRELPVFQQTQKEGLDNIAKDVAKTENEDPTFIENDQSLSKHNNHKEQFTENANCTELSVMEEPLNFSLIPFQPRPWDNLFGLPEYFGKAVHNIVAKRFKDFGDPSIDYGAKPCLSLSPYEGPKNSNEKGQPVPLSIVMKPDALKLNFDEFLLQRKYSNDPLNFAFRSYSTKYVDSLIQQKLRSPNIHEIPNSFKLKHCTKSDKDGQVSTKFTACDAPKPGSISRDSSSNNSSSESSANSLTPRQISSNSSSCKSVLYNSPFVSELLGGQKLPMNCDAYRKALIEAEKRRAALKAGSQVKRLKDCIPDRPMVGAILKSEAAKPADLDSSDKITKGQCKEGPYKIASSRDNNYMEVYGHHNKVPLPKIPVLQMSEAGKGQGSAGGKGSTGGKGNPAGSGGKSGGKGGKGGKSEAPKIHKGKSKKNKPCDDLEEEYKPKCNIDPCCLPMEKNPCKKTTEKSPQSDKKTDPGTKKDNKKKCDSGAKEEKPKTDPCAKDKKKSDTGIKDDKKKSDTCAKKEDKKKSDPCAKKDDKKKLDPCAKKEDKKKSDPCAKKDDKKKSDSSAKKDDKKKSDPCAKKEDKKKSDPCAKKDDKKKSDPCAKKDDKKKSDPCAKKEDKKKSDPCAKKDDKKKLDPCAKKDNKKKSDPCTKKAEQKKPNPCTKKDDKKKTDSGAKKEKKKPDHCGKDKKKVDTKKSDPCLKKKTDDKKKLDPCAKDKKKKPDPCAKQQPKKKPDTSGKPKASSSKQETKIYDPCAKKDKKKQSESSGKKEKKTSDLCGKWEKKEFDPCGKKQKSKKPTKKCFSTSSICQSGIDWKPRSKFFSTMTPKAMLGCRSLNNNLVNFGFMRHYSSKGKKSKKGMDYGMRSKCKTLAPKKPPNRRKDHDPHPKDGLRICYPAHDVECPRKLCKHPQQTACGKYGYLKNTDNNKRKENKSSMRIHLNSDPQNFLYTTFATHCSVLSIRHFHISCKCWRKFFPKGLRFFQDTDGSDESLKSMHEIYDKDDCADSRTKSSKTASLFNETLRIKDAYKVERLITDVPNFSDYDVLIRTSTVAISGSDIHVYEYGSDTFPDITLGHDAAGIIVQVGERIKDLKPGDRVAMEPAVACGICEFCKRGTYNMCLKLMYNGFFMKYQAHPADLCHKIPDELSMAEGALTETLAIGCQAVYNANVTPMANVLIMGSGATAVASALCARAKGAKEVVVLCTMNAALENIEKQLEFKYILDSGSAKFCEILESIHNCFKDWPDVVINSAINERTMNIAGMALKPCGVCILAQCDTECASFNAFDVLMKNIRLVPSFRSVNMFPTAIQLMNTNSVPISKIIASCYRWDDVQDAFRAAQKESNCGYQKVIIQCEEENNYFQAAKR